MGYKVNPPSTEELRQMAMQRLGAPVVQGGAGLTEEQSKKLLEELAISKIEVDIQNVYLQETCARLDVALNEITDLYDFAPIGFFSIDMGGRISKLNLAGGSLLGLERNALMGRALAEFFPPEQRERIQVLMRRATASGEDQQCDATLQVSNRMPRHVQVSLSPLYSTPGYHVALTDITGRKLLENELRSGEERWKSALDAAADGVWDWDLRSGTLHYSPKLAQLLGVAPQFLGNSMEDWRACVHPDDWAEVQGGLEKCIDAQEQRFCSAYRARCADGSWKWVRCQGVVFGRDEEGKATRLVGTHTDLSARKRLEEELLEVGGIQQAVFGSLPHYLAVLDSEGRVMRTNAVWDAYGLAIGHAYRGGFVRLPYADLLDAVTGGVEQIRAAALAGIADVLAAKVPSFQLDYSFVKDTQTRWFIMNVMVVRGGRARAVVSHQDVTRIKSPASAQLAQ